MKGFDYVNRCDHAMKICSEEYPELVEFSPTHMAACHLYYGKGLLEQKKGKE
jgi:ABC-type dipeptide/oligopeptide/nickel transport system ATPase component